MIRFTAHLRKTLCFCLTILLLVCAFPVQALATEPNTLKEEVVYVNLNANGAVEEINVVNIFNLPEGGTITDYGIYESLRNMTSTAPIKYKVDTITIDAAPGKLYYEGKLSNTVIPWNIDVRYYLDGEELTAKEVAGKSGNLKIAIDISRNQDSNTNFFAGFALQVSLTLDTAKCSHIVATDATIANVGSSKQITYTILPSTGANLEITSTVSNFSMDGISINAIPLNLNVELDDAALMSQVNELMSALAQLDNGASSLHSGISDLQSGAQSGLAAGVSSLHDGASKLESGALELKDGGATLHSGALELKDGAVTLNDGIQTLHGGLELMQNALNELNRESSTLKNGSSTYYAALKQLQQTLDSMTFTSQDLSELADASSKILGGLTELVSGTQTLQSNVSFEAMKAIMASNGLNVDSLISSNNLAMAELRKSIDENAGMINALKLLGYDASALFAQLEQVILLLGANNAFIDGTETYLNTVNSNIATLISGAETMRANYAQFDAQITKMVAGLKNVAISMTLLNSAINSLVSEYSKLDSGINTYTGAVTDIISAYSEIVNGSAKLAAGSKDLVNGSAQLYDGTGALLDGIAEIYEGAGTLRGGADQLDEGMDELLDGIAALYAGSSALESGTSTMLGQSQGIDGGNILGQIDDLLASITGEDVEITSFVSEENTNVESVQFVIKTASIQPDEQAHNDVQEEVTLTFWQKLLKLFGLSK